MERDWVLIHFIITVLKALRLCAVNLKASLKDVHRMDKIGHEGLSKDLRKEGRILSCFFAINLKSHSFNKLRIIR